MKASCFPRFFLAVLLCCTTALAADTLTMKDGTKHTGTFVGATARTITFREGRTLHHYPRTSVQSLEFGTSAPAPAGTSAANAPAKSAEAPRSKTVVLPAGTEIAVLTNQEIDSATAQPGQTFTADIAENVTDSAGRVVIPKGSEGELVLRKVSSGGVTSNPELALDLQSVKVGGRRYTVNAQDVEQKGTGGIGANKRTAEMVGGGAVLGTLIGAIAGHGKGAAIGAATGAAAGAGAQILTRGKTVKVPAETTLRFKLDQPLRLDAAY
jgi:outer membrane lipoprotein SlyB